MVKNFNMCASHELVKRIDDEAWRQRKNRSEFIRDIIQDYFHNKAKTNKQKG